MIRLYGIVGILLCVSQALFVSAQSAPSTQAPPNPVLKARPAAPPRRMAASEGRLHLDLSVTDTSGNPVTDLEPWDLKLLDNGQPAKILSFRGYDGKNVLPDPPVEVILLIDVVNVAPSLVAFMRDQAMLFLRQNGGRPALPISIMVLTYKGLRVQPQPSLDGNGMADMVHSIQPSVRAIYGSSGAQGAFELQAISLRELYGLVVNEARRPGRKLLLWMGAGWPLMDSNRFTYTDQERREFFSNIVALQNGLRQAQITLYGLLPEYSGGINESTAFSYRSFLKPVASAQQVLPGNLGLGVLAEQSGGGILGPSNDLVAEMNSCLVHASAYYRISFDPPPPAHFDEYHALHIAIDRPGLTIRTDTGYYDEPGQAPF